MDVGGGLAWTDRVRGVTAEISARTLLTHEAHGLKDRGVSAMLAYDPTPGSNRGLSMRVTQNIGGASKDGMAALFGPGRLSEIGRDDGAEGTPGRRLDATIGYGLPIGAGRFTATPEIGFGGSQTEREYTVGWRLEENHPEAGGLRLQIETTRRETTKDGAGTDHGIKVSVTAHW